MIPHQNKLIKRPSPIFPTRIFVLVCSALTLFAESPALELAAKHLEDYQQQRKICGKEDELATLRLQVLYLQTKVKLDKSANKTQAVAEDTKQLLKLCAQAYHLARSRYEHGTGSLQDVYETAYILNEQVSYYHDNADFLQGDVPTEEDLVRMRETLKNAATAANDRAAWLRAEVFWFRSRAPEHGEMVFDKYKTELITLLRERYQQGLISYWELACSEQELKDITFNPKKSPAEAAKFREKLAENAAEATEFYRQLEQHATATGRADYQFTELLLRARLRQLDTEWLRHLR